MGTNNTKIFFAFTAPAALLFMNLTTGWVLCTAKRTELKRNWIGIDNPEIAIEFDRKRLSPPKGLFNLGPDYEYLEQQTAARKSNSRETVSTHAVGTKRESSPAKRF